MRKEPSIAQKEERGKGRDTDGNTKEEEGERNYILYTIFTIAVTSIHIIIALSIRKNNKFYYYLFYIIILLLMVV